MMFDFHMVVAAKAETFPRATSAWYVEFSDGTYALVLPHGAVIRTSADAPWPTITVEGER